MNKLEEYDNKCMICKKEETILRNGRPVKLSLDHCHNSSKFRGLLCNRCNRGIGMFEDNIEILQSAIDYLNNHKD